MDIQPLFNIRIDMNEIQFCYWLQGFFELEQDNKTIDIKQKKIIKDHLALVFKKETPDYSTVTTVVDGSPLHGFKDGETFIC